MIDIIDKEGEAQDVGEENEFLSSKAPVRHLPTANQDTITIADTHMPDIAADLPARNEKIEGCHPFVGAQSGLAGKVMQVQDEP